MDINEFLDTIGDPPIPAVLVPMWALSLFLTMLDEYNTEQCSTVAGKIKARLTPGQLSVVRGWTGDGR
jgi:hypothetical protein